MGNREGGANATTASGRPADTHRFSGRGGARKRLFAAAVFNPRAGNFPCDRSQSKRVVVPARGKGEDDNDAFVVKRGLCLPALAVAVAASAACADEAQKLDPIVTTATKTATKLSDVPASVTVITAEEIEAQGNASVAQIISRTPGVSFWGSGGVGTSTNVTIRGMEEEHTLLLVDGVRMNNPADQNSRGAAAFDSILTDNIERIEIVRGPMASLYGSNASGGVVNIITKKGASDGYHGSIKGEYGSFNTRRLDANVSYGGKMEDMPFVLSYAHSEFMADGPNISDEDRQFASNEVRPSEDDRRIIYKHSLDFRASPTSDLDGRVFFSLNDSSVDQDNGGADADRNVDSRTYSYGTVWDSRMLDGRLENKEAVYGMNASNRRIYNNQKPAKPMPIAATISSSSICPPMPEPDHKVTGGLSYDRSRAERKANMRSHRPHDEPRHHVVAVAEQILRRPEVTSGFPMNPMVPSRTRPPIASARPMTSAPPAPPCGRGRVPAIARLRSSSFTIMPIRASSSRRKA
jgi:hypothetical protein